MQLPVTMPDLGTTVAEILVSKWLAEVGETVRRGQVLLEVETDKAALEVEAIADGVLAEIRAPAGEEVVTGDVIAVLQVAARPGAAPAQAPPADAPSAPPPSAPAPSERPRRGGSFFARNRDRRRQERAAPTLSDGPRPLSPNERVVARRMTESKQNAPHFYLQTNVNAEPMAARR